MTGEKMSNCWQFTSGNVANKNRWVAELNELVCEYLDMVFSFETGHLTNYNDYKREKIHEKIAKHLGVSHESITPVFSNLDWFSYEENGHAYIFEISDLLIRLKNKNLLNNNKEVKK
jgi:hypothetical protein